MAVMAWAFYKERILHYDTAWLSFLLIQEGEFTPALGRWGIALGQILTYFLLDTKAELPLLLKSYSVFLVLLYLIYLVIIGVGYKSRVGIIALCIAMTLTFRETFFYTTAELFQGTALSVVLWVIFRYALDQTNWRRWMGLAVSTVLIFCISYFHPLGFFTVFFVLSVEYVRRQNWKDTGALAIIIFAVVWYFIRIKFFINTSYEAERMISVADLIENISQVFQLPSTKYFFNYFKGHYIFPFIAGVAGLVVLFLRRQWLVASYILLYFVMFWIVIMIGKREEGSPIMLQNYYTVFGLFGGIIIALALEKRSSMLQAAVVMIVCLQSLLTINQSRYNYQLRTKFIENIIDYGQQFPEKKYVMHMEHIPWSYSWMNWALPFGSMMYSHILPDREPVTCFATMQPDTLTDFDINRAEAFLGAHFEPHWFTADGLNQKYFGAKSGPYRILNTRQTNDLLNDSLLSLRQLKIVPAVQTISKSRHRTSTGISIANETTTLIASIPEGDRGIFLYYRLLNENQEEIHTEFRRLLVDIAPGTHYNDILEYNHPKEKNAVMEIGFYIPVTSTYFAKASIELNPTGL